MPKSHQGELFLKKLCPMGVGLGEYKKIGSEDPTHNIVNFCYSCYRFSVTF